jgi:hypothetical protein
LHSWPIALSARVFPAAVFWQSGQTKVAGWHLKPGAIALFQSDYQLPLIDPTHIFEVGGRVPTAHLRNGLLPVFTEIAQERANDLLAQLVTRATHSSGRVASSAHNIASSTNSKTGPTPCTGARGGSQSATTSWV